MKLFPKILISAVSLACVAGASAQSVYTKVRGDACPAGQRMAEFSEVKNDLKAGCAAVEGRYVARLANGGSIGTAAGKCELKKLEDSRTGYVLCVSGQELANAVGTYAWNVGNKGGADTTLLANGTCSNTADKNVKCVWKVSNLQKRELTLNWGNGVFIDTMILSADGKVMEGKNGQGVAIKGVKKNDAQAAQVAGEGEPYTEGNCSPRSKGPVAVTFENRLNQPITMQWIDFDCKVKVLRQIPAHGRTEEMTFPGHIFRFVDSTGRQLRSLDVAPTDKLPYFISED